MNKKKLEKQIKELADRLSKEFREESRRINELPRETVIGVCELVGGGKKYHTHRSFQRGMLNNQKQYLRKQYLVWA